MESRLATQKINITNHLRQHRIIRQINLPQTTQAALAATLSDRINANSYNNAAASAAQSCCGV
jgi:hypothetical protein